MNYQLFGDNTMNVLVDDKVERRAFKLEAVSQHTHIIVPHTHAGETVKRDREGNIEIIKEPKP